MALDPDHANYLLSDDGPISAYLKGYEARPQQQEMLRCIVDAYNGEKIALVEAGTGTGKSLAYLIPAILWSRTSGERTVISTNTINLQEQLISKDIPLLCQALNIEIKAVLVKGMRNYVCLRKLEEAHLEIQLMPPEEAEELVKVEQWCHTTRDGSRATLPFVPSHNTWDRVCAENDTCSKNKCPLYQDCHFFKARKQADDAQLLVVNHHLLFADLSARGEEDNYKDPAVLPVYNRIILDEAHHIEDVATAYFADSIDRLGMLRTLGRLAAERQGKSHGKLPVLKEKITEHFKSGNIPTEMTPIMTALNIDLPIMRQEIANLIFDTLDLFLRFLETLKPRNAEEPSENKLRLLPMHMTHPDWETVILPKVKALTDELQRYVLTIEKMGANVKQLDNEKLKEVTKGILFEITALGVRLLNACQMLEKFVAKDQPVSKVKWIEGQTLKSTINVLLVNAQLDINQALADFLFNKMATVVLCSATLTTNKHFQFIRNRLGLVEQFLEDKDVIEASFESPFDYQKQALLVVPQDMPDPTSGAFTKQAAEAIWDAIQASRGNAFVLFTSYSMLKQCYQMLQSRMEAGKYYPLKQGDDNRNNLLQQFKSRDRSVLFGTDSFWEGVDVAGEALRCVIIVKLPFKVPSEPIIQARTEALKAEGKDPFMEYSLPNAIVKFKQGFGRLIRNRKDRGCIVCLDSRIIHKRYGQEFLNSLPPCKQLFIDGKAMKQSMEEFYKKTYHLTLK